jgi:radical SAM protein with 4Fe4S-binding SPASM domain
VNILSYADFSSKVHAKSSNKRIPLDATLELTYRCNNKCVHCYCNLPENDEQATKDELTTEEIKKLLDDLASMGSLWLLITGGEPLLRPDFEEIYLYAKKKGFLITLFSNGTLINENIIKILSGYPPFYMEITLYGATKETYEKVTRVKGSYENCIRGISKIIDAGIKLRLKTMALTINQHEIEAMDRVAREMRCEFRFDQMINKRLDSNTYSDPAAYRISPEDTVRLDTEFPQRMKEFKEFCERMVCEPVKSDRLINCGAVWSSIQILPNGTVLPCSMLIKMGRSIRERSLKEIWEVHFQKIIDLKRNIFLKCDNCTLQNLCGQCAGWSLVEHGEVEREVQYLCDITQKRAEIFPFLNNNKGGKDEREEKVVKA